MAGRRSSWLSAGRRAAACAVVVSSALVLSGLNLPVAAAAATPAAPGTQESYERPDLLGAQLLARTTHHQVLVTGMTSDTSQTWVNADGSLDYEEAAGPVRSSATTSG